MFLDNDPWSGQAPHPMHFHHAWTSAGSSDDQLQGLEEGKQIHSQLYDTISQPDSVPAERKKIVCTFFFSEAQ